MSTLNAGETLQPFKPLRNNLIFDSSGNLVGIQNDRANGTDLRLNGGSAGTFSSLVVQAAGTLDLYNTADQTTNYERLRADWSGNVGRILTQAGGTGVVRGMSLASGTYAGTSGTTTALTVNPEFNQSGTAGYTALDINPTETATGSGTKLLQRWAVGGSVVGQMPSNGAFVSQGVLGVSYIGLAPNIGGGVDIALARDAADTLALRRSTNAQNFRVYNTYTDGSNYERGGLAWISNVIRWGSEAAGTGTVRNMEIMRGSTTHWSFNSSGNNFGAHLLASVDNSYDIGAGGANRPRNLYLANSASFGAYYGNASYFTVATLSAAGLVARARAFVNDSTVAAAGNFGAIVAGGGANIVPVFSDGTNWRIG